MNWDKKYKARIFKIWLRIIIIVIVIAIAMAIIKAAYWWQLN